MKNKRILFFSMLNICMLYCSRINHFLSKTMLVYSFLTWRHHHSRLRAAKFDHIVIEQWGFFGVLHLLWQWTSVYSGHLGGPVTLTCTRIAERFVFCSVAVTTCFNDLGLLQLGFEHPTFRLQGERSKLVIWFVYMVFRMHIVFF